VFKKLDNWVKYVIVAYLLFWSMVLLLGGSAAMVFKVSPVTMRLVALVCAWAPTFAFLIMYKKLIPTETLSSFLKRNFRPRINIKLAIVSGAAVAGGVILPIAILSLQTGNSFASFFSLQGYSLVAAILFSLLAGPTGEEIGWRGYLRVELAKKYSFLKASIIGGVIWAFWHAVLWLIDADFVGIEFLLYVLSNVVVMTSIVVIMNTVLAKSGNLLNAIWLHLCFNFPFSLLQTDSIKFFVIMTFIFPVIAFIFLKYHYLDAKK
jgi:membrane protease YdiL (CAAX protease family)